MLGDPLTIEHSIGIPHRAVSDQPLPPSSIGIPYRSPPYCLTNLGSSTICMILHHLSVPHHSLLVTVFDINEGASRR